MTATRPSPLSVRIVMDRAMGFCEIGHVCGGAYLSGVRGADWAIHHRRSAGSGGSRLAWVHAPSNLLATCNADHLFVHAHPPWAQERGLTLKYGQERALTTVVDCRHGRVLLDDVGTFTYAVTV